MVEMIEIMGKPKVLHILDCLYRGEGNVTKTNKQTTSDAQVLTEIQMTMFRILKTVICIWEEEGNKCIRTFLKALRHILLGQGVWTG